MRACRLGLVDSHSSQVARVLVEPHDRAVAAAVLSDASCVLVSLAASSKQVLVRGSPCSDACFLRLQVREPAGGDNATGAVTEQEALGGGLQFQFGQFGPTGALMDHSSAPDTAAGKLGRTFFLLASPSKGGSCTDIRAWSCDNGHFKQVPLEAEVCKSSVSGMAARFDIPHGVAVKMVASVNFVALYSATAGKVWILAARTQEQLRSASESSKPQSKAHRQASILLMKCAVVDCTGPVYTIHLSLKHLFLGEMGGVRVIPLRPLVKRKGRKGGSVCHSEVARQKMADSNGTACNSKQKNLHQHIHEELVKSTAVERGKPSTPLNGLYGNEVLNLVAKKNGFVCEMEVEQHETIKDAALNLDKDIEKQSQSLSTHGSCGIALCSDKEACVEHAQEVCELKSVLSHGQRITGVEKNGFISGQQTLLRGIFTQDTKGGKHLGLELSLYAPLAKSKDMPLASQQVVSICALSAKTFMVLDSSGMLHVLILKKVPAKGRPKSAETGVVQVEIKPVEIPFNVSSLAVLPPGAESGAPRKMWVSDGRNSIHILSIPEEIASDDGAIVPPVMQVVFVGAQIDSLVAISAETVLAIAEGTLVAYVKAGS